MKPAKKTMRKPRSSGKANGKPRGFTAQERAAMRARLQELKGSARRGTPAEKTEGEGAVRAKRAELPASDRAVGERIHALIKANAPNLTPRTWYAMPAYAQDGNVVCLFQSAQKFRTRYATRGFSDKARLEEGRMWPTAFAVRELTGAEEARIVALVKQAVR